jgi:hypothetical protein
MLGPVKSILTQFMYCFHSVYVMLTHSNSKLSHCYVRSMYAMMLLLLLLLLQSVGKLIFVVLRTGIGRLQRCISLREPRAAEEASMTADTWLLNPPAAFLPYT